MRTHEEYDPFSILLIAFGSLVVIYCAYWQG